MDRQGVKAPEREKSWGGEGRFLGEKCFCRLCWPGQTK